MSQGLSFEEDKMAEAINALVNIAEFVQENSYVKFAHFFPHLFEAFSGTYKADLSLEKIESSYTGVHFGDKYEENDFIKMVDSFKHNQQLHAKYALRILRDAVNVLKTIETIRVCDLSQSSLPAVVIVGDLHGNFHDLRHIIKEYGIPGKNYRFVFNGDIVDRGPQQCECLLTILYAFLMYPHRIFINRGNHEDKSLNFSPNFEPNFKTDTTLKFRNFGESVLNEALRVFRYLPMATIIKNAVGFKAFVCHGGVSSDTDLNCIQTLQRQQCEVIAKNIANMNEAEKQVANLLWSDPIVQHGGRLNAPSQYGVFPNRLRGIGTLFGPDVTDAFCKKNGFNCIIRSHEVRPEGVTQDHPKCFTIFSASNYCQGTNKAAVIILSNDSKKLSFESFATQRRTDESAIKERNRLILIFKQFLTKEMSNLNQKFIDEDSNQTGYIDIDKWAEIISEYVYKVTEISIDKSHIITLKDYLCPCDDERNVAKYDEMFGDGDLKNGRDSKTMELLENIFSILDTNRSGTISTGEGARAVAYLNKMFKANYDASLISAMDTDGDGEVDLDEFKKAFLSSR